MAVRNVYFIPCLKVKNTVVGTEVLKVRFVSSFVGIFKGIHFDTLHTAVKTKNSRINSVFALIALIELVRQVL